MELRLGGQVFRAGDFALWSEINTDTETGTGPVVLIGDQLATAAAAAGAALVCTDPERAARAGVRLDGIIVDAGTAPSAALVERLVSAGHPVLVTLNVQDGDPSSLAAISIYAWLGVRVFRVGGNHGPVRQVLDMVASINGIRPPALSRRALA